MNLLVTGGLGFIGSNFVRYILNKYDDINIVNYDAMFYGSNPNNLSDVSNDSRYSFVKGDIRDLSKLKETIKKYEISHIVNFAAETHVDRSISNPLSFFETNIFGVINLLEITRDFGIESFLQVSTDEVYGSANGVSFRETDALNPSSPYSSSKASADLIVKSYVTTYGVNAKITRCTNNYGPYQFPEKLIPKTIIRTLMGLKIPIYGKGDQIRDWLYVLDHCSAIDLVLNKGKKGEIYNISAGEEKKNIEVVEKILELLGRTQSLIEFVEDRPGHDVRYSLDSTKIKSLGWKPKVSFSEGIKYTVEWYKENESWWKPLIDDKVLSKTPWKLKW